MTPHLLVTQLRFTRSELVRCLEGVSEEDAQRHLGPMHCLSWIVGHLANEVHFCWVMVAQHQELLPGLDDLVGYNKPASTPTLEAMWAAWHTVTRVADLFLDTLTPASLLARLEWRGKPLAESTGTLLLRNIYHYWFHLGEAHAIRQQLGHQNLPEFVGDMKAAAYYQERWWGEA